MLGLDEIKNRFGFHKGTVNGPDATVPQHQNVRKAFIDVTCYLDGVLPDGRAKSCAFTALEEAAMWSNKAVAETAPLVDE